MITKTFTPRDKTNDKYFLFEIPFDGDAKSRYSCEVIGSNLPTPEFKRIITKNVNGLTQNYIVLEMSERHRNTQVTVNFLTESEEVEQNKVKFLVWLASYFTWFNFIFRIFSLKALKRLTVTVACLIFIPVAFGFAYATVEFGYEKITGNNFEDSAIVEFWSEWTVPKIGKWLREEGPDKLGELNVFIKDKSEDAKDKIIDITYNVKDKAGDIKDKIKDTIE